MPRVKTEKQNEPRGSSQCSICQTVISNKTDMPRHMKIHSVNKAKLMHRCPYPDCKFENLQKSNVETHIRTHTKAKTERCPDCDFSTVDPGSLTRHRKRMHGYIPKARRGRQTPAKPPPSPPASGPSDASTSEKLSLDAQKMSLQVRERSRSPPLKLPPIQSSSLPEPPYPGHRAQSPFDVHRLARYNPQPPHQIRLPPIRFIPQPPNELAPCYSRRHSHTSARSRSVDSESASSLSSFSVDTAVATRTPPNMGVYRSLPPPVLPPLSAPEKLSEHAPELNSKSGSTSQHQLRPTRPW